MTRFIGLAAFSAALAGVLLSASPAPGQEGHHAVTLPAPPGGIVPKTTDWPVFRGPTRDGVSPETGWTCAWPKDGPKALWKATVGTGFSSVNIAAGRAYTMGNAADVDTVFCMDAESGKPIWKVSYPCALHPMEFEGGPTSSPTIEGDAVYTFSREGQLFRWRVGDEKPVWSRNLPKDQGVKVPQWGFASSPIIEGKLLIVNAGTAGLAVDKETGKTAWTTGNEPSGFSTPAIFTMGSRRYAGMLGYRHFAVVDVENGLVVWQTPWQTQYDVNATDALVAGDKLFVSSAYDKGSAVFQFANGKFTPVWQNQNLRSHFNAPVLHKDFLYGPDETSYLRDQFRCVDFATGQVKWTQEGLGVSSVVLADGKLIILSDKGELVVAEATPDAFKELARALVMPEKSKCWTPVTLSAGRIYARNAAGLVVCLDVRAK